jgi:hypothetical protein
LGGGGFQQKPVGGWWFSAFLNFFWGWWFSAKTGWGVVVFSIFELFWGVVVFSKKKLLGVVFSIFQQPPPLPFFLFPTQNKLENGESQFAKVSFKKKKCFRNKI